MSLRYQIITRILISAFAIVVLGGAIAIWRARLSVEREVDASVHLALQLITLSVADAPLFRQAEDLSHLRALQQTRHLSIQLQKPDGRLILFTGDNRPAHPEAMPPAWFIGLMRGNYPTFEQQLKSGDGKIYTLLIQAQPLDEITEVWQESVVFFLSILLLTVLTFVLVNLVFNKSLQSIAVIVASLREIEAGRFQRQLPAFAIAEFDIIARAVNHLMGELHKTQLENRALTQHTLAIQEDERRLFSRELHDEFGQSLTAIKVMAVAAARQNTDTARISAEIAGICDHLVMVVRSMMQQLHPLTLTELGFKTTLEETARHWAQRNPGLELHVDCEDAVDLIDKSVTIQVFRVIQECLTNVVRHAQADHVRISLELADGADAALLLRVEDDGRGCDLESAPRGFGLLGMQERIKSLHGQFSVASASDAGMTVSASIPLTNRI
ncbi:MAG: sensor histidine kinase [Methylomonas sp.]|jgi:two-component system sensor histidine kinase UhpB